MSIDELLSELHCAYCGSSFTLDVRRTDAAGNARYGVFRCACYAYPLVDGIPVTRQNSSAGEIRDETTERILSGDFDGALALMLGDPVRREERTRRGLKALFGSHPRTQAPRPAFHEDLAKYRSRLYGDYLFYRYANNSFLGSMPVILALSAFLNSAQGDGASRRKRVLDIGCGIGHATHLLTAVAPHAQVIATDHDFVNLHQARQYVIPNTLCVCCDAEAPLPFADEVFDAVMCTDAFHYIRSKVALVREMDRVAKPDAVWTLPHLHNATSNRNPTPGTALPQADYRRVLGLRPLLVLREDDILDRFAADGSIDLRFVDSCPEGDVYSALATRRADFWRVYDKLDEQLVRQVSNLAINPIYRVTPAVDELRLRLEWPNSMLASECAGVTRYMSEELTVDRAMLGPGTPEGRLTELVRRFVFLPLPQGYDEIAIRRTADAH